jgi:ribosomal protein S10
MAIEYSLKLKSIHFKYLLLGVLAFLDILKKKEQVSVVGVSLKKTKKVVHKYTVLRSPFINKKSREQFKLQLSVAVLVFSLKALSKNKKKAYFLVDI